jgi:hypothetical protein
MQGTQVVYNGRSIAKDGFRAFIYAADGITKLVNSWEEYIEHIASGTWFSNPEEAIFPLDSKEDVKKTPLKVASAPKKKG